VDTSLSSTAKPTESRRPPGFGHIEADQLEQKAASTRVRLPPRIRRAANAPAAAKEREWAVRIGSM
jgi:hypothetical protein